MNHRREFVPLSIKLIASFVKPCEIPGRIYIAYSGGVDSHVLLHLCASNEHLKDKIIAVYVHHGLQKQADIWANHCQKVAEDLSVDFVVLRVNATRIQGESPEEAARNARYNALKKLIGANDMLMLGQHREDQLETILLQLFRGSGLRGLSGMPERMAFGQGILGRPMLNVSKLDILDYAEIHQLNWVEDPSNHQMNFDRNLLRNEILPRLKQRWPSLDTTVSRSAQHCADAQQLISEFVKPLFDLAYDPIDQTLNTTKLTVFTPHQRNWILRQWFETLQLKPPSQAVLQAIVEQMLSVRENSNAEIRHQDHFVKRYRQKIFCLSAETFLREPNSRIWSVKNNDLHLANGYTLSRVESTSGISQELWQNSVVTISNRQGGEQIKLPGRNGHHDLKKLWQEAGIPPWEREVRPLVFLNNQLAAVPGLWIAEWAWTVEEKACYQLKWELTPLST
jgi:tRNA(Ile)-lysidine synthase